MYVERVYAIWTHNTTTTVLTPRNPPTRSRSTTTGSVRSQLLMREELHGVGVVPDRFDFVGTTALFVLKYVQVVARRELTTSR